MVNRDLALVNKLENNAKLPSDITGEMTNGMGPCMFISLAPLAFRLVVGMINI